MNNLHWVIVILSWFLYSLIITFQMLSRSGPELNAVLQDVPIY